MWCDFDPPSLPTQLLTRTTSNTTKFKYSILFLPLTRPLPLNTLPSPRLCSSSSLLCFPSLSPVSLSAECRHEMWMSESVRGRESPRNKTINKKSRAFSVPPHYMPLTYAFCSGITHYPQINALIFLRCKIDFLCPRWQQQRRSQSG